MVIIQRLSAIEKCYKVLLLSRVQYRVLGLVLVFETESDSSSSWPAIYYMVQVGFKLEVIFHLRFPNARITALSNYVQLKYVLINLYFITTK